MYYLTETICKALNHSGLNFAWFWASVNKCVFLLRYEPPPTLISTLHWSRFVWYKCVCVMPCDRLCPGATTGLALLIPLLSQALDRTTQSTKPSPFTHTNPVCETCSGCLCVCLPDGCTSVWWNVRNGDLGYISWRNIDACLRIALKSYVCINH